MRRYFLIFFTLLTIHALAAEHNPLLPQPQTIRYGNGQLQLKGLSIGFAMTPAEEDRFAARELARLLSEITGQTFEIDESSSQGSAILLKRTGQVDPLAVPGEETGKGTREYYKLEVDEHQVSIASPSSAGLYYGVQTLKQLVEGVGAQAVLPEVDIEDWPSLAYRGFMMDMSHTQLPRVEEIKRQLDFLASWKANQYYFYTEASIELEGYPLLMADARFTREQVREIIDYGRQRHIDVIPNMELYGHLHDLFRLEQYSDMAVIPHGGEFRPDDPRVAPIIRDWVTQISQLFPSPFFHIGFDETWLIKKEAEKMSLKAEDLYLKMLTQTTGMVEAQGKTPLTYADMLQKFPSIIPDVPENTIAIAWHYHPKDPKEYEPLMKPFQDQGLDLFIQSACINWYLVSPSFTTSFHNTDLLLEMGQKYGATGFINSGWTDDTQTLMRLSFPDLAYGSAASWHPEAMDRNNFFKPYSSTQYPAEMADHMYKAHTSLLKGNDLIMESVGGTDVALFDNPFKPRRLERTKETLEKLREGRLAVEQAQTHFMAAMEYGLDTLSLFAMLYSAKTLDYIALKYMYASEITDFLKQVVDQPDNKQLRSWFRMEMSFKYHTRTSDMLDAISVLKEKFRQAWLNEYTPFRLEVGLGKYDLELQSWLKFQMQLEDFILHFDPDQEAPSLEVLYR